METDFEWCKKELDQNGFTIIDAVFTDDEVAATIACIETGKASFAGEKKLKNLFAIRKIFKLMPGIKKKILNNNIKSVITAVFGPGHFIIKGLYFNKPPHTNWLVPYHQDLSVSVTNKSPSAAFTGWTVKDDQYGVQPPLAILESIYTIRVHLDDCTAANGALHVIPGSHLKGIYKPAEQGLVKEAELICEIAKGGIMIMRPLLLHSSQKSTAATNRRALHLEFCNKELPDSIRWAEKEIIS